MKRVVTESAKREAVCGTVVLRALLHSDGSVIEEDKIYSGAEGWEFVDASTTGIQFQPVLGDG